MPTFEDKESLASVRSKINDAIVAIETVKGFDKVAVAGQGTIDADGKSSTLNLEAGSNIVITTNASTDTVTISSTASGAGVTDGDKGDITVSGDGTVWTIDNGAVDLVTKISGTLPSANFSDTSHGPRAGGNLHANATASVAGFMSGADKTKLDGVAIGATANTGTVVSVTGTAPIVSSGGTAPAISITAATTAVAGSMSAADKTKLDGIATGANLYVHPNHTGDVTSVADGATTITANAVTNAKLAQAVANTLKGNNTGATANVADLTTSQVKTMLAITTADVSGLGSMATQSTATYLNKTETYNAGHAPEGQNLANAFLLNDFANARFRGSVFTTTNITLSNAQIDGLVDGKGTYLSLNSLTQTFPVVIEFTLPRVLTYGAYVGLSFGNVSWRTRGVKIETLTQGTWTTLLDTTTNTAADIVLPITGNSAIGTSAIRYTFNDPVSLSTSGFRILHLWGYNYNSDMWSQVMMQRAGGSFYGAISAPSLTLTTDLAIADGGTGASDAPTARANLGLGTLATQSGTFSGTSSGTNTGDQNIFQSFAVSGQSTVVANTTTDTLTLAAGAGVSITTNAATDTITVTNSAPDQTVSLAQAGTVTVTGTYPSFTITGAATDLSYTASTRVLASSTGVDATLPIFTSTDAGLVPASGGGTTTFLRADGTWATAGSGSVSDPLQLSANSAATPTYSFSTDTDTGLYLAGVNSLGVSAGGSNKMTVDSTGVFVNNTSGSDPFEVTADTLSSAFTVRGRSSDDIATTSFYDNARTTRYGYLQSTPTKMRLGSQASIPLELLTNNTAQLTLGTAGEIGLGSGIDNGIQGEVLTSNGTGVSPSWGGAEYWLMQESVYTLTSSTAVQKLFNASTNGTLTLPIGTYMFECVMYVRGMSATSGNAAFHLRGAGNAVVPRVLSHSWGRDALEAANPDTTGGTYWEGLISPQNTVFATTATMMLGRVHGIFRISGAGTLIPSIDLTTASAAAVQPGSYFWCKRLSASDTATTFGPWS